jgi:ABC-2 type transport system permease protein
MIRLLSIELNKLRGYRAFWILTILYFVGLAGTLLSIQGVFDTFIDENVPGPAGAFFARGFYNLPDGWHLMTWIASIFNLLLPTVVIIVVCAEFGLKTVRQNVINGMSRAQWMAGKLVLMAFFALASTLVVGLITLILGLFNSDLSDFGALFSQFGYVIGYFIQTTGYLLLATLLSILIRNTGVTIGIMTIYSLFLELVIENRLPEDYGDFLPLRAFSNLVMFPFSDSNPFGTAIALQDLIVSLGYIGLFAGIGFWILKRRDL